MFEKKSIKTVAEHIFQSPDESWHLRELARETGLSTASVSTAIETLEEQGIVETETDVTKTITAQNDQQFYDTKRAYNLWQLTASGLIDVLEEQYRPDAIVLFGSYSRGEDMSDSDIDIAILEGTDTDPDLGSFEEQLGRPINIVQTSIEDCAESFIATLANGVVLRGYLSV